MSVRAAVGLVLGSFLLLTAPSYLYGGNLYGGNLITEAEGLRVELASEPERPLRNRETTYTLRLRDASGSPVNGVKVTLAGQMADGMTVITPLRPASEPGVYSGRLIFTMEGEWQLRARVVSKSKPFELRLTEQVGR